MVSLQLVDIAEPVITKIDIQLPIINQLVKWRLINHITIDNHSHHPHMLTLSILSEWFCCTFRLCPLKVDDLICRQTSNSAPKKCNLCVWQKHASTSNWTVSGNQGNSSTILGTNKNHPVGYDIQRSYSVYRTSRWYQSYNSGSPPPTQKQGVWCGFRMIDDGWSSGWWWLLS